MLLNNLQIRFPSIYKHREMIGIVALFALMLALLAVLLPDVIDFVLGLPMIISLPMLSFYIAALLYIFFK